MKGHKRFSAKAKPSRSMSYQNEKADNDLEKAKNALIHGATIETTCGEYWIKYSEGGTYRITKRIFNLLNPHPQTENKN